MKSIKPLVNVFEEINDVFKEASRKIWEEKKPDDYCSIGMSHCRNCGWQGEYPVSGCPSCHSSFVE